MAMRIVPIMGPVPTTTTAAAVKREMILAIVTASREQ